MMRLASIRLLGTALAFGSIAWGITACSSSTAPVFEAGDAASGADGGPTADAGPSPVDAAADVAPSNVAFGQYCTANTQCSSGHCCLPGGGCGPGGGSGTGGGGGPGAGTGTNNYWCTQTCNADGGGTDCPAPLEGGAPFCSSKGYCQRTPKP